MKTPTKTTAGKVTPLAEKALCRAAKMARKVTRM
jgi:hypothetical protein